MKIQLINQDHTSSQQRLLDSWIQQCQPTCQIPYHCQQATLTIRELQNVKLTIPLKKGHPQRRFTSDSDILESCEYLDGFANRRKLYITKVRVIATLFILQIFLVSKPDKKSFKICSAMTQRILIPLGNSVIQSFSNTKRYLKNSTMYIVVDSQGSLNLAGLNEFVMGYCISQRIHS